MKNYIFKWSVIVMVEGSNFNFCGLIFYFIFLNINVYYSWSLGYKILLRLHKRSRKSETQNLITKISLKCNERKNKTILVFWSKLPLSFRVILCHWLLFYFNNSWSYRNIICILWQWYERTNLSVGFVCPIQYLPCLIGINTILPTPLAKNDLFIWTCDCL